MCSRVVYHTHDITHVDITNTRTSYFGDTFVDMAKKHYIHGVSAVIMRSASTEMPNG